MSAPQHTTGPWSVATGSDQFVCSDGFWIASTMGVRGEEGSANARLMAAAPELLAALEVFVAEYVAMVSSGDCGFWDAEVEEKVVAARAAIAKARGQ